LKFQFEVSACLIRTWYSGEVYLHQHKTLKTFDGKNVSVENGDLVNAIKNLKSKDGRDMIV
jgi:uncharacterized Zn ribbon protein